MEGSFGQNPGIEKRAWSMRSQESKGSETSIISLWWVEFFFWDRKQLKIMLQESEESVVESFGWADQTVRISQCWVILSFWKNELAGKCGVHGPLTSGSQKWKNKSKNLLWTAGCLPVLSGNPLERTGGLPARKHLLEYISPPSLQTSEFDNQKIAIHTLRQFNNDLHTFQNSQCSFFTHSLHTAHKAIHEKAKLTHGQQSCGTK